MTGTTIRFRADNFEAEATLVDFQSPLDGIEPDPVLSCYAYVTQHWVVSARSENRFTLRLCGAPKPRVLADVLTQKLDWAHIFIKDTRSAAAALALAISLLYSVPGVEVVE